MIFYFSGFNTKLFNNYSLQMYLEQFDKQKQQLYLQNVSYLILNYPFVSPILRNS